MIYILMIRPWRNKASSHVIEWIVSFILSVAGSLMWLWQTVCHSYRIPNRLHVCTVFQTPLSSSHLPTHIQAPSSWDAVQHLADRFLRTLTGCWQFLVIEKGVSLLVRNSGACSICAREMWGESCAWWLFKCNAMTLLTFFSAWVMSSYIWISMNAAAFRTFLMYRSCWACK